MNSKTIVILGGGVGGLVAANELRQRLTREHKVIVVEKSAEHVFSPSFIWLMTGSRKSEDIAKPLSSLLRPGIEFINAQVSGIDLPAQNVLTSSGAIKYDYLVIALGAELAPESIPGLNQAAYSFYSFEETKKLSLALPGFNAGKIAVVVCSLPYKCPGAPHEAAMLLADYFSRRGLRDKVSIDLYTPEPQPMPVAGPKLGEAVKQMLSLQGISFHPAHKLISVNPDTRELFFEGNKSVSFDLLIAIPPHRAPALARAANLSNEAGWIPVDRFTLQTKTPNVYAIGDNTAINIPGRWKPEVPMSLPKAGVFAHLHAETIAARIADEVNGRLPDRKFDGLGYCMLEAGGGRAGFAYGNFFGEPSPQIELRNLGRKWHLGKVLFEKWWLAPFGFKRALLRFLLNAGSKLMKLPIKA